MPNNMEKGSLESRKDFKETPGDQYIYWQRELGASDRQLRQFRKLGTKIVDRFLGGASKHDGGSEGGSRSGTFRLNLFHSNVVTLQGMLYVDLPQVVVKRRFDDANDDTGRVASTIMQRLLTNDIQENGKEYECILKAVLQDRLLPGLGVARVRYEVETETDPLSGEEVVSFENAPIDYYHWRDVSWGWGRTFTDIPWIGFRTWMKKDAIRERFGDEAADGIQLKDESVVGSNKQEEQTSTEENSPWKKGEIWEIWDKTTRKIVWMSPGYDKVLETQDDTLELTGFYPCSPFLVANQTTSLYVPVSDFYLAQDLYNEVDVLQTRISIITEAVKVVGLYDKSSMDIKRMFKEGTDNELIPVDNWALFAEKGGISGQIDWVPIEEISSTLLRLRELRDEAIGLLQQVTGMSDIMRGELGGQYEGVGQSQLKAKFGSVRVQALQDDLAKFASDLLQLKAEVISRHFEPETIARRANLEHTFDMELVPAAIELIKNPEQARLRVKVKPESVGMADYAQLKQERTEYITALASFFQATGPVIEAEPGVKPFFLEILKWGLAGFKGSESIESVMDKAIELSNQAAIANPEDLEENKEAEKERAKSEGQMQLENLKHQNAMQLIQAKVQADAQTRQNDLQADMQTKQNESQMSMQVAQMEMQATLAEIKAKAVADMQVEQSQSQMNAAQQEAGVQSEVKKEGVTSALEIGTLREETRLNLVEAEALAKIAKEEAEHQAKMDIKVAKAQPKPEKPDNDD